jgi:hypothetical protein
MKNMAKKKASTAVAISAVSGLSMAILVATKM